MTAAEQMVRRLLAEDDDYSVSVVYAEGEDGEDGEEIQDEGRVDVFVITVSAASKEEASVKIDRAVVKMVKDALVSAIDGKCAGINPTEFTREFDTPYEVVPGRGRWSLEFFRNEAD